MEKGNVPHRMAVDSRQCLANGTQDSYLILIILVKGTRTVGIIYDGTKEVATYGFSKGDLPIQNPKTSA